MTTTTTTTVSDCFLAIGKKNSSKLFVRQVDVNNITSSTSSTTRVVVIVVHGGPGLSDHSESFAGLRHLRGASTILFFDQLGCGKSVVDDSEEEDTALYTTLKGHVQQLQHVIEYCQKHFDDDDTQLCVLGHSWGGQVLLELLLSSSSSSSSSSSTTTATTSAGIDAAIISNTPLDEHHYQEHQRRLRASLEDDSIRAYYEEQDAQMANEMTVGAQIYRTLIGASDTNITGEMKDWSALSRLSVYLRDDANTSSIPCLFVSTKDDSIPHEDYQLVQQELPKATTEDDASASLSLHHQVVIMEQGGHGPFFGATAEEYFNIIEQFWKNTIHDGGTSTNGRVTSFERG
jgi:pimeloyl-ACP methyl ester carboxylesterase